MPASAQPRVHLGPQHLLGADGTQLADAARQAFVTSMTSSL
jgi:hypothetical protein